MPKREALLSGHTDSVLCLAASHGGGLLASGAEDGRLCLHDLSAAGGAAATHSWLLGDSDGNSTAERPPITGVAFHPRAHHTLFVAAGDTLLQLDVRGGSGGSGSGSSPPLIVARAPPAADELSAVAVHPSGAFAASADDAGDVCIFDVSRLSELRPARRLSGAHEGSLASCVAFRQHKPWEVLTGGLDCRVACWDLSRGTRVRAWSMHDGGGREGGGAVPPLSGRICNPPMVHALAVPPEGGGGGSLTPLAKRTVAAARGDGVVAVFDADGGGGSSGGCAKHKGGASARRSGGGGASTSTSSGGASTSNNGELKPGFSVLLGGAEGGGGHTRPASAVCFLPGARGALLASGGEDGALLLWAWQRAHTAAGGEAATASTAAPDDGGGDGAQASSGPLVWRVAHGRKVNALCAPSAERLLVASTSRLIARYALDDGGDSSGAGGSGG